MHELSVACGIVEVVAEAARGRRVHRVVVEIGELSGVVSESISFWFPEVVRGTEFENARLEIQAVSAAARCDVCATEFPTPTMLTPCPCGSFRFRRIRGEELNVRSIELEEVS